VSRTSPSGRSWVFAVDSRGRERFRWSVGHSLVVTNGGVALAHPSRNDPEHTALGCVSSDRGVYVIALSRRRAATWLILDARVSGVPGPPTLDNRDILYVGTSDGHVYAKRLDGGGHVIWRYDTGRDAHYYPVEPYPTEDKSVLVVSRDRASGHDVVEALLAEAGAGIPVTTIVPPTPVPTNTITPSPGPTNTITPTQVATGTSTGALTTTTTPTTGTAGTATTPLTSTLTPSPLLTSTATAMATPTLTATTTLTPGPPSSTPVSIVCASLDCPTPTSTATPTVPPTTTPTTTLSPTPVPTITATPLSTGNITPFTSVTATTTATATGPLTATITITGLLTATTTATGPLTSTATMSLATATPTISG